jgi:hypothetical protein
VLRLFESPAGYPPVPPARLVERLDALAVVTLRLETAPSRGRTTRSLWLSIDFAPHPGLAPRVEAAASTLQEGAAALADFERGLGPRWTRHAVLATVAREFALLGDAAEPPRLRALQPADVPELPRRIGNAAAVFTPQARPEFEVGEGLEVTLWAENPLLHKLHYYRPSLPTPNTHASTYLL